MVENNDFWNAFVFQHIFFLCQIAGIGLHAMSGTAPAPGSAPGIPGHATAITPKTWTEGIVGKRCGEK